MFQKLLRKIAKELNTLRMPYMVIGGQAVLLYGEPRFHKIVAGRGRDIEDVKAILLKNPNYNVRYINGWLKEFDKSLNENFSAVFHEIIPVFSSNCRSTDSKHLDLINKVGNSEQKGYDLDDLIQLVETSTKHFDQTFLKFELKSAELILLMSAIANILNGKQLSKWRGMSPVSMENIALFVPA